MPIAQLGRLNLYYETHGPPDNPPLVLLHGACETFALGWSKLTPMLAQHFHVVGLDMRGHGRSDNPANKLELPQLADDVAGLLGHLGIASAHVCGFSGGGSAALFFALRHAARLRSLVLVSNNMERDTSRDRQNFWNPERQRREEPIWWKTMEKAHGRDPAQLLLWWQAEDRLRPDFQPADLAVLTAPTLIVSGDRDPIIPLDQTLKLFRALPNAQLAIFPGVGHGAPRKAALFSSIVVEFLTKSK